MPRNNNRQKRKEREKKKWMKDRGIKKRKLKNEMIIMLTPILMNSGI